MAPKPSDYRSSVMFGDSETAVPVGFSFGIKKPDTKSISRKREQITRMSLRLITLLLIAVATVAASNTLRAAVADEVTSESFVL